MKICIPTNDDRGLEAESCEHFGSAPFFTLCDLGTEDIQTLKNPDRHHAHGDCRPTLILGKHQVDAVVCRGLGRNARASLRNQGYQLYDTREPHVKGIVEAFKAGQLKPMSENGDCGRHGHEGQRSHHHRTNRSHRRE